MAHAGHATNAQILDHLRKKYQGLMPTTVHRITGRLVDRGELILAPVAINNVGRFDANILPHDHFHCLKCDRLRDVELPPRLLKDMQSIVGDCKISGRLTIQGACSECLKEDNYGRQ